MSVGVKIIADSIGPAGVRLTTFELRYGRAFHQDMMTYREWSRNGSSSRAIPWKRMRQEVLDDPWVPIDWGVLRKGMQAGEEQADPVECRRIWLEARDDALRHADRLHELGLHKVQANRLIQPWSHIRMVVTSNSFTNFFDQRCHRAAVPEIQQLAVAMARDYRSSTPRELPAGRWHLPYITDDEDEALGEILPLQDALVMSTARCARISYRTLDDEEPDWDRELRVYRQLVVGRPIHASPAEHQAMATGDPGLRSGNFRGWVQHRKCLVGEYAAEFAFEDRLSPYEKADYVV